MSPRTAVSPSTLLEHVVDTVLSFEGDRHHSLRLLRAATPVRSHRRARAVSRWQRRAHGRTHASALFLADRARACLVSRLADDGGQAPDRGRGAGTHCGRAVRRPGAPHVAGHRRGRLALLLAVLHSERASPSATRTSTSRTSAVCARRAGLDLAVCMAVVSALTGSADAGRSGGVSVRSGWVASLRQVAHTRRR